MKILHTVTVSLGKRSYPIQIGRGLLAHAGELLPFDPKGRTLFVLADENVADHAEAVAASLRNAGARAVNILSIAAGERSKSMAELENILSWLLNNNVDRQSVLFAVGGGVIG